MPRERESRESLSVKLCALKDDGRRTGERCRGTRRDKVPRCTLTTLALIHQYAAMLFLDAVGQIWPSHSLAMLVEDCT